MNDWDNAHSIVDKRHAQLLAHIDPHVVGWQRPGTEVHSHDDVDIFGLNVHRLCEPVYANEQNDGSTL